MGSEEHISSIKISSISKLVSVASIDEIVLAENDSRDGIFDAL